MADGESRRFALPPRIWLALGAVAALQIGLLALNVLGIARQEQLLERQLGLAERSYDAARPAVQDARRLLDDARDNLPRTKDRAREAAKLLDRTRPLLRDASPLVTELSDMDAAGAIAAVGGLALRLEQEDRLVALIDRSRHLVDEVHRAGTPGDVDDLRRMLDDLFRSQRRSLGVQRKTLRVQIRALEHIRSLDRKTGGKLPGS